MTNEKRLRYAYEKIFICIYCVLKVILAILIGLLYILFGKTNVMLQWFCYWHFLGKNERVTYFDNEANHS